MSVYIDECIYIICTHSVWTDTEFISKLYPLQRPTIFGFWSRVKCEDPDPSTHPGGDCNESHSSPVSQSELYPAPHGTQKFLIVTTQDWLSVPDNGCKFCVSSSCLCSCVTCDCQQASFLQNNTFQEFLLPSFTFLPPAPEQSHILFLLCEDLFWKNYFFYTIAPFHYYRSSLLGVRFVFCSSLDHYITMWLWKSLFSSLGPSSLPKQLRDVWHSLNAALLGTGNSEPCENPTLKGSLTETSM